MGTNSQTFLTYTPLYITIFNWGTTKSSDTIVRAGTIQKPSITLKTGNIVFSNNDDNVTHLVETAFLVYRGSTYGNECNITCYYNIRKHNLKITQVYATTSKNHFIIVDDNEHQDGKQDMPTIFNSISKNHIIQLKGKYGDIIIEKEEMVYIMAAFYSNL